MRHRDRAWISIGQSLTEGALPGKYPCLIDLPDYEAEPGLLLFNAVTPGCPRKLTGSLPAVVSREMIGGRGLSGATFTPRT